MNIGITSQTAKTAGAAALLAGLIGGVGTVLNRMASSRLGILEISVPTDVLQKEKQLVNMVHEFEQLVLAPKRGGVSVYRDWYENTVTSIDRMLFARNSAPKVPTESDVKDVYAYQQIAVENMSRIIRDYRDVDPVRTAEIVIVYEGIATEMYRITSDMFGRAHEGGTVVLRNPPKRVRKRKKADKA